MSNKETYRKVVLFFTEDSYQDLCLMQKVTGAKTEADVVGEALQKHSRDIVHKMAQAREDEIEALGKELKNLQDRLRAVTKMMSRRKERSERMNTAIIFTPRQEKREWLLVHGVQCESFSESRSAWSYASASTSRSSGASGSQSRSGYNSQSSSRSGHGF